MSWFSHFQTGRENSLFLNEHSPWPLLKSCPCCDWELLFGDKACLRHVYIPCSVGLAVSAFATCCLSLVRSATVSSGLARNWTCTCCQACALPDAKPCCRSCSLRWYSGCWASSLLLRCRTRLSACRCGPGTRLRVRHRGLPLVCGRAFARRWGRGGCFSYECLGPAAAVLRF